MAVVPGVGNGRTAAPGGRVPLRPQAPGGPGRAAGDAPGAATREPPGRQGGNDADHRGQPLEIFRTGRGDDLLATATREGDGWYLLSSDLDLLRDALDRLVDGAPKPERPALGAEDDFRAVRTRLPGDVEALTFVRPAALADADPRGGQRPTRATGTAQRGERRRRDDGVRAGRPDPRRGVRPHVARPARARGGAAGPARAWARHGGGHGVLRLRAATLSRAGGRLAARAGPSARRSAACWPVAA